MTDRLRYCWNAGTGRYSNIPILHSRAIMGFQRGSPPLARFARTSFVRGARSPLREHEGRALVCTAGATKSAIIKILGKITNDKSTSKPQKRTNNRRFYCAKERSVFRTTKALPPLAQPLISRATVRTSLRSSCVYRTIREYFFQRYFVRVAVLRTGVQIFLFAALSAFANEMI